jgi:hypothetical protein
MRYSIGKSSTNVKLLGNKNIVYLENRKTNKKIVSSKTLSQMRFKRFQAKKTVFRHLPQILGKDIFFLRSMEKTLSSNAIQKN